MFHLSCGLNCASGLSVSHSKSFSMKDIPSPRAESIREKEELSIFLVISDNNDHFHSHKDIILRNPISLSPCLEVGGCVTFQMEIFSKTIMGQFNLVEILLCTRVEQNELFIKVSVKNPFTEVEIDSDFALST